MLVLQLVDFLRKGVGGVVGSDVAGGLENSGAAVVMLVNKMYGDAAFSLVVGDDRLVHMLAVHAFAAVFGQQGRVYVDNPFRKSRQQVLRHKPQKTSQNHIVDIALLQVVSTLSVSKKSCREK